MNFQYGTGSIAGIDVTDNVQMISQFSVNYEFISVEEALDLSDFPSNGLMGLNNDDSEDNFVDLAYSGGYIVVCIRVDILNLTLSLRIKFSLSN